MDNCCNTTTCRDVDCDRKFFVDKCLKNLLIEFRILAYLYLALMLIGHDIPTLGMLTRSEDCSHTVSWSCFTSSRVNTAV